MDTILRNIPMPKIFLQAVVRDADTYRIVIDGQQRIKAILTFLKGDFKLTAPYSGDYFGRTFSELPPEVQEEFLSYKIDVNEIRNAPKDVVRDIYLRVNKYTVALNRQELRRADYPGEFLSLAEDLAQTPFFEDSKIFTVANSKRMGDVEYVSELIALLIGGIQEKREALDDFYLKYMTWDKVEKEIVKKRFLEATTDIQNIWDTPIEHGHMFSEMRFRQKADFYGLFAAIDECRRDGGSIDGKPLTHLKEDFELLDVNTEPESQAAILRKYAIQCVSQANTAYSRGWRKDFLKLILQGSYTAKPPNINGVALFHSLLWDLKSGDVCPTMPCICPICADDSDDYRPEHMFLTWKKDSAVFQLSNSVFVHNACAEKARAEYYVWEIPYKLQEKGNLRNNE
jgi:hypothetical protein